MKKIFKILRLFLEGGCVGITIVNIGHIIANNMSGILLEETNRMALINIIQFILFGVIIALGGRKIRDFKLTASIDRRMRMLRAHSVLILVLIILSIISIVVSVYCSAKICIIVSAILSIVLLISEIGVIVRLKSLRRKIFLK